MAWAILTSGGEAALLQSKITIPSGEDFTLRFIFELTSDTQGYQIGELGTFSNAIALRHTTASVGRVRFSGVNTVLNYINPMLTGVVYDLELQRVGGVIDLVDTVTQATLLTSTVINDNAFLFDEFFRWANASNYLNGKTQLIALTSVSNNNKWDATASDHSNTGSQPVLVETIGGNNAVGVNFPTDGSAWVDLGGGGNDVILDVDNGAFSLSGSDVLFMASRIEQALTGNYNLSGSDIDFSIGYAINLDGGIYSLSGSATGLVLNANTVIESGEYSLTGTQANLDIVRKSIIESGSYNLTGSDVTLVYTPGGVGESLFIDSGAFSLTGSDIGLKATRLISVNSGSYNLTGQEISLTYNAKTIIDSGSYALIGSNVNLFANRVIIANNGSYTLSGTSVILKYSGDTYKTIGTVTAGFAQDRYSAEYKPTTITVNFKD